MWSFRCRTSSTGKHRGTLLDEMRHPFLEIFRAKRCEHLLVGDRPGFRERLEIRLENLPFDDADRAGRLRRDQFARDRLYIGAEVVCRQSAHQAKPLGFGRVDHARRVEQIERVHRPNQPRQHPCGLEDLGSQELKGITGMVRAWRIASAAVAKRRLLVAGRRPIPLRFCINNSAGALKSNSI